jgi:hypothetical protein
MPIPRETFIQHVQQQALSVTTRRVYVTVFGKLCRQLVGSDLHNLVVLQDYRGSMNQGSRNMFDATWHHLVPAAAELGVILPEIPQVPRMRLTHPLQPDLTLLSGVYGNHGLAQLTWSTGRKAEALVREACSRVYSFQTGRSPHGVDDAVHVCVNGPDHQPMQEWRIEYIINSERYRTAGHVERASEQFFSELATARVNGMFLRDVATDLWRARNRLERRKDAQELLASWLEIIRRRQFLGFRAQLQKHADPAFETRLVPW